MKDAIVLPTTKEEALAAGVPEEVFDPALHLFSETVVVHPPQTLTQVNAEEPTAQ